MKINWYPGHMHKARKDILKALKNIDLLIELVDARLPFSSQNPIISGWRQKKPTLVIFNKADLADPLYTSRWQTYFEQKVNIKTMAYHKREKQKLEKIATLCRAMVPEKTLKVQSIQAMVLGIPNVGKSTLINALAGRTVAKVGNEPAVTKQQQLIHLNHRLTLHDTPGILWPNIENPNSGFRLAIIGSIKNTAVQFEDIGDYAADYLLKYYPERLIERYQLDPLPKTALDCLEAIGKKRGARRTGSGIDLHKAAEILIHDLRSGKLGKLTMETPEQVDEELTELDNKRRQELEFREQRAAREKNG